MTKETFKTNFPADAVVQLRGDFVNKMGRALNDASGAGRTTGASVRRGPVTLQAGNVRERWVVSDLVKNLSAGARRRGEILQLGDTLGHMGMGPDDISDTLGSDGLAPVFYEPCMIGKEPQGRVHQIGVLMGSAAVGEVVECQLSGVCTALVNVTSKAHRFVKAVKESHVLQSAMCGHARFYWKPNATGEQLCRIVLGIPQSVFYWGKTTTSLSPASYNSATEVTPGTGTAELWEKDFATGKLKAIFADGVSGAALTDTVLNLAPEAVDSGSLIGIASDDDFNLCNVVDFCVNGFA